jgi:hypothetical protein
MKKTRKNFQITFSVLIIYYVALFFFIFNKNFKDKILALISHY